MSTDAHLIIKGEVEDELAGAAFRDTDLSVSARVRRIKDPQLQEILAYSNTDVVYRFSKTFGVTIEESEDIFDQVKRWLWLSHHRRTQGIKEPLSIDMSLVVIDEMWHNFVLFTKEYFKFCKVHFGYYLHHAPATEKEDEDSKAKLTRLTKRERVEAFKNARRPQYQYVYDKLGKECFQKWYVDYPQRYSYINLMEMQLATAKSRFDRSARHQTEIVQPLELERSDGTIT